MDDRQYRKVVNSWALYDWANSGFGTTVMCVLFPPFHHSMAIAAGMSPTDATATWAYTVAIALGIVALLGPILGAASDYAGKKKAWMGVFLAVGATATAAMVFLGGKHYLLGSVLFILGEIGFVGSEVFYESLLPHIAREGDMDRVSARGYAYGYIGAGLLLVLNVAWFVRPAWFMMPDKLFALRASFLSVAAWWVVFSIPLFRHVPEPPAQRAAGSSENLIAVSFKRLGQTFRHIRLYRQLLIFLAAYWLYNDGIGTIIKMATVYGEEVGVGTDAMSLALIVTQFVGIPATLAFGWAAGRIRAKRLVMAGLAAYAVISVAGYFMHSARDFCILAIAVGLVQGGTQALSRSIYGAMIPKKRSTEFFGFLSTSGKFAGIFGPMVFGAVGQITGSSRFGIVALVLFFVAGVGLLFAVNEDEGMRVARAEDQAEAK